MRPTWRQIQMGTKARKLGIVASLLAVIPLLAWALVSWPTVVTPQAALSDPVEVFIVDHGRTTSLVVPASDGLLLRYAYGDWNWYALGKHGVREGIAALLWPTPAALGRGLLTGPATADGISRQVPEPEEILSVRVERARLRGFVTRMEALYDSRRAAQVSNPDVGLSFVPHPHAYSALCNSNQAVASWLRELGSTTRGPSIGANWQVSTPRE
jgi:hypothetical protein